MLKVKMQSQGRQFNLSALTQATNMGMGNLAEAVPHSKAQVNFTHTMVAKDAEKLYVMGDGSFDPNRLTQIIAQDARDRGIPSVEMVTALRSYLQRWSANPDITRGIVGVFTGFSNKGIAANRVREMAATSIKELVTKVAPSEGFPLYEDILTDWLVSVFHPFGWVSKGYEFVYKVSATSEFPGYQDIVESIASHDVRRMLESLGGIDKSIITNHIRANETALSTGLIAQQLSSNIAEAITRVKGSHMPEHLTDALLTLVAQALTPATSNDETFAPRSILESDIVNMFSRNLAIFHILQERTAREPLGELMFDYPVITSDILPLVKEALTEISPFAIRPIADVLTHVSKSAVRDYRGLPIHTIIHENIEFPDSAVAFTRTQIDSRSTLRMLNVDQNISEQMSSAMIPVTNQFSLAKMVAQKHQTADLLRMDTKLEALGSETTLMFPSFLDKLPADSDFITGWNRFAASYIPLSTRFTNPTDEHVALNKEEFGEHWKLFAGVIQDHYKYLTAMAVHSAPNVFICAHNTELGSRDFALEWSVSTDLVEPIGRSAIIGGLVTTTEPLEALQYTADIAATSTLKPKMINLEPHERNGLHAWDWKSESTSLEYATEYTATLRGGTYKVALEIRHLLGLTMTRKNVRLMTNRLASMTAKLWFSEIFAQIAEIKAVIERTKDDIKKATYQSQLSSYDMMIAKQLMAVGNTSMGRRGTSFIKSSIQHQMYDLQAMDDYTHLHQGVQATLLDIWMGLTTLESLGLLGGEDIRRLADHIRESGVLAHVISEKTMV